MMPTYSGKLTITLQNTVRLNRSAIPQLLVNFLKDELNFANSAFVIKKKSGKSTFETPRFFKLIKETEHEVTLPRGFIGKLIRFCREMQITHDFIDNRMKLVQVDTPAANDPYFVKKAEQAKRNLPELGLPKQ